MQTAKFLAILLVIVIGGSLSAGLRAISPQGGAAETSRISGLVLDKNDARIVGATIRIANAGFQREVRSDDEGRFEVNVLSGTYDLTVEQPGFRKFHFPKLQVQARTCELINVHMEVLSPNVPLKIDSETPAEK